MDRFNERRDPVKLLVQCGLFTALVAVGTLISFPIAGGHGFINLGDAVIHTAAFVFGGWHCAAIAAIGSALADVILGYSIYVPGTLIVKGLMAFVSGLLIRRLSAKSWLVPVALSIAGIIVPAGYFLYELLLSALGAWEPAMAVIDLPWNLIQYAAGAVIGTAAILLIEKLSKR